MREYGRQSVIEERAGSRRKAPAGNGLMAVPCESRRKEERTGGWPPRTCSLAELIVELVLAQDVTVDLVHLCVLAGCPSGLRPTRLALERACGAALGRPSTGVPADANAGAVDAAAAL